MTPVGKHYVTYYYSDIFGCDNSTTDSLIVDYCTRINELFFGNTVSVYPNPSVYNSFFNIDITSKLNEVFYLEVIDVAGKCVLKQKLISGTNSISNSLNSGTYTLIIKSSEQIFRNKLVVY